MNRGVEQIAASIIRYRVAILLILSVVTVASVFQFRKLSVYNDIEIWIDHSSDEYTNYKRFVNDFGKDESAILLYHSDSLSTNSHLQLNYLFTDSLKAIPGVSRVISLATIKVPSGSPVGPSTFPLLPKTTSHPERLKERLLRYQTYQDFLISEDFLTTSFVVIPEPSAVRRKMLEKVEAIAEQYLTEKGEYIIFGIMPLKESLNQLSYRESKKFLLISGMLILLICYAFFGRLRESVLPLVIAVITICWTIGLMAATGAGFNVVISAMPLILLVVVIANAIHLISGQLAAQKIYSNRKEAVVFSFANKFRKCLYASLTTATALLSFTLSDIVPLKQFGLFSAIGVMLSFALCFLLIPVIYSYIDIGPDKTDHRLGFLFRGLSLSDFLLKHKKKVYTASVLVLIMSAAGMTRLSVNTDQVEYFRKQHPVRVATEKAQEWFSGIVPFEVVLLPDTSIFESPASFLAGLQTLETKIDEIPEIRSRQSLVTIFEDFGFEGRQSGYAHLLLNPSNIESTGLSHFVSADGKSIRTTLKTAWMKDRESNLLIKRLEATAGEVFSGTGTGFFITGVAPIFAHLGDRLVKSQIRSFLFTFIVIFCLFLVLYKNVRLALLCMIPNILPVAATLGVMGFLNISLDVTTVLIASISFGIAVDDTIHFAGTFLECRRECDKSAAIDKAYLSVGKPLIINTLLFAGGFIIMVFSGYRPLAFLGVLVSANIVLALVYDLVVLPSILLLRR